MNTLRNRASYCHAQYSQFYVGVTGHREVGIVILRWFKAGDTIDAFVDQYFRPATLDLAQRILEDIGASRVNIYN